MAPMAAVTVAVFTVAANVASVAEMAVTLIATSVGSWVTRPALVRPVAEHRPTVAVILVVEAPAATSGLEIGHARSAKQMFLRRRRVATDAKLPNPGVGSVAALHCEEETMGAFTIEEEVAAVVKDLT